MCISTPSSRAHTLTRSRAAVARCVSLYHQQLRLNSGGGPQPEWRYRVLRIAQAKPEVVDILRDFAAASRDRPSDDDEAPRWIELPPQSTPSGGRRFLYTFPTGFP